jgi:ABC-type Na+ efflux pump permease subunit
MHTNTQDDDQRIAIAVTGTKDYYELLGVARNAEPKAIKQVIFLLLFFLLFILFSFLFLWSSLL